MTSSNALLTLVSRPDFQTITQTNGIVALIWSATTGQRYQLQYKPDLSSINWMNLGTIITATNHMAIMTDVIGSAPQRFYQVVILP